MKSTETLTLQGLRAAPSQVAGAFRLVPLIRENKCSDVRLYQESYGQAPSRVELNNRTEYWSIIPHGFILDWSGEKETSSLPIGAQLRKTGAKAKGKCPCLQNFHRLVKKQGAQSLRMLPLHLSMEYFLGLCFGGPTIAWDDYSEFALRLGLGFRLEQSVAGRGLYLFEEALRQFEINDGQVGVLVYAAEELASAFVVPRPEDYFSLHDSLLADFYGELIFYYALSYSAQELGATLDTSQARDLADLRRVLLSARQEWSVLSTDVMAAHLLGRQIECETVYRAGDLSLQRFMTVLDLANTNTIGERLIRPDGELLYLKTYRLGRDQTKRAWWLTRLAAHDWHLQNTAKSLNMELTALVNEIDRCGFGYLLNHTKFFKGREA